MRTRQPKIVRDNIKPFIVYTADYHDFSFIKNTFLKAGFGPINFHEFCAEADKNYEYKAIFYKGSLKKAKEFLNIKD